MVSTDIPISENQPDWLKGVDTEATVKNHIWQMLQNFKKPVYITKLFAEEQFELQNSDFSSNFFLHTETKVESNKTLQGRHSQKGIQRTPPYLTYIRDSIDQGATHLGGL